MTPPQIVTQDGEPNITPCYFRSSLHDAHKAVYQTMAEMGWHIRESHEREIDGRRLTSQIVIHDSQRPGVVTFKFIMRETPTMTSEGRFAASWTGNPGTMVGRLILREFKATQTSCQAWPPTKYWQELDQSYETRQIAFFKKVIALLTKLEESGHVLQDTPDTDSKAERDTRSIQLFEKPTGWLRVDRVVNEIRRMLSEAENEEHFQAIGHHCRELLISIAQAVYDHQRHGVKDEKTPSTTDAKLMLDRFVAIELAGESNEVLRRQAKSALALANELQHDRNAEFRQAALCAEASFFVVNTISILAGRRDITIDRE